MFLTSDPDGTLLNVVHSVFEICVNFIFTGYCDRTYSSMPNYSINSVSDTDASVMDVKNESCQLKLLSLAIHPFLISPTCSQQVKLYSSCIEYERI